MSIQANKSLLESMGLKRFASSLTSLVDSTKEKKRKGRIKDHEEDDEYVPEDDHEEDEQEKEAPLVFSKKAKTRGSFIPPMSLARHVKMNKKQVAGSKESLGQEKAFGSQRQMCEDQDNEENNCPSTPMWLCRQGSNENESNKTHDDAEIEKDNHADTMFGVNLETSYDQDGQFGGGAELEDASPHDVDGESMSSTCPVDVEEEPNIPGIVRKTRGTVYCRKLIALPPGEKINVEFDEDGNEIGSNSSLFSFFLGQQVRNRAVCPVQVNGWEDFKPETLDHLWACILEKCNFDDPDYRKESVMKHARRLYRDSRHKLKEKYFNDPKLTTKDQRLKNKPPNMVKSDWKYLVDYWSDPKFKEKSDKASKSRSFQKMPHYNGTKSYASLKQEIKKKNGGKCTRLDVMVESRKRKSKKLVNDVTLAHNMHAIDEMKKLKEQREQGLNEKTDEQIFLDVLGKDTHGYLRAHGPNISITKHFQLKPSQLNLVQEVAEIKKTAEQAVLEARKDAENARKDAEDARKEAGDAKNEVKETRNEVDQKIAANNRVWEKKLNKILQVLRLHSSNNHYSESDHDSSS